MRVTRNAATAEQMFKTLIPMIRECKKTLDSENKLFAKIGVDALMKGQAKVMPMLTEFYDYYSEVINTRDLKNVVSENILKTAIEEYEAFQEELKQYHINLQVTGRVSQIFLDNMKNSIKSDAKKDYGYTKDGNLISDKKALSAIPSISVNNKV